MGVWSWVTNFLQGGRVKNEPERQTDSFPFPFGFLGGRGTKQSTPKRTPANLRLLSESPIPRRAINIIKDGITKLNWSVTAVNEEDQEKYQPLCTLIENVLKKPNSSDSFRLWLEQIVEDMLVASAGVSEKAKAGDVKHPLRLYPVDAFSIELYSNWDGKPNSYRYAQRSDGKQVDLKDSELMYIRMNPRSSTPFGLSPLETVWESVTNFITVHRTSSTKANTNEQIINLGKGATPDDVKAFRAFWEYEVKGRGQTPIISGESPSVLNLGTADDKALHIEWQRFLIEIVATAFGVSPKKLGQTKDVNRNTADSENDDTNDTIFSIAENISEHINNEIIDGFFKMGDVLEFKFLYATSLKELKQKAEIDAMYLDRGVDTPDEVRNDRGKKALPNKHGEIVIRRGYNVHGINKPLDDPRPGPEVPEDTGKEDKGVPD
ncbi:phage portal protein [Paenibacillus chitinolyticus]|uniref:Phage portal protein n=1 Tax=Paenibacillus chitinolyticus TaxID=79263 RepID=A0A410X0M6_9BACL|nr:phage portal protein [Paenibacillus chitinolyticus]MCY9593731.1 phage portal protein [Paenibacillus chitinolyticus]MCY9599703.1 phage portal protein [Paenibacillus chitinolyticus]QAV20123.1 phage portal protein [Paenibacillus chitinolyticus]